jgi:hypothetical protein
MSTVGRTSPARGEVRCERRADDTLLLRLVGDWRIDTARPVVSEVYAQLEDVSNLWICYPLGVREYHQHT